MRKNILFFILFFLFYAQANQTLKQIILEAKPGSKIELSKGVFKGPITIDKPLILIGKNKQSIIENDHHGKVITIKSPYVTIKNLTIRGSGHQRYSLDSGIFIEDSSHIEIDNCDFNKTLFGIILHNVSNSKISNNQIRSYQQKVVDNRGDGIRLWESKNNIIINNTLIKSRDISLIRSNNNLIKHNTIKDGRYGILIDISNNISILSNKILSNYVGIWSKNGKNIEIKKNVIVKTHLSTGIGIMLENGKNIHIMHNRLTGHAQAIYINSSPAELGMRRYIYYNNISYNNVAFHFYATIKNNSIQYNNIIGNLEDVVKDIKRGKYYKNDIQNNYWDRYIGFDKDGDGISDIPYQALIYADKLWQFNHHLKFFYATPLLSIVDFLERLAPFSEPVLLLEDIKPKTKPIEDIDKG